MVLRVFGMSGEELAAVSMESVRDLPALKLGTFVWHMFNAVLTCMSHCRADDYFELP